MAKPESERIHLAVIVCTLFVAFYTFHVKLYALQQTAVRVERKKFLTKCKLHYIVSLQQQKIERTFPFRWKPRAAEKRWRRVWRYCHSKISTHSKETWKTICSLALTCYTPLDNDLCNSDGLLRRNLYCRKKKWKKQKNVLFDLKRQK